MAADGSSGGGERPRSLLERHPPVLWCLTCAILVGFGVFMVYIFERALYDPPEFKAIVSAYEGLDAPAAGAGTAPTFRVALRVRNELNRRAFCAERGAVAVSYAGVPLARAALPGFCVPGGSVGTVPVVATGEGTRAGDARRAAPANGGTAPAAGEGAAVGAGDHGEVHRP